YDSLLVKRRSEIHERIGQAIEELYADRLEEFYEVLARHYSRSNDLEKAYQYLKLSGDKAIASYSVWEALRFRKEAVDLLNKAPETVENKRKGIEARLLLMVPMRSLGYPEDCLQIVHEGEMLAKELGDNSSLAKFYSAISVYHLLKGDVPLGRKYVENCFEEAAKIEDIELMATSGSDLCAFYNAAGEYSRIAALAPKVLGLLESTQKESEYFGRMLNSYAGLSAYYGIAVGMLGSFEQGEAFCEKSLRFALDLNDKLTLAYAEFWYGALFCAKGDGENAIEHLQNASNLCEETQYIVLLGMSCSLLGLGYYFAGDLETAGKHMEKGLAIHHNAGLSMMLSIHYWALG
ncbi:unnamed protein product, partial [marine sediment metagenome]